LMLLVTIFTMQGGLLAVAITDTIMCIGMVIAALFVYVVIIKDISTSQLLLELGKINQEIINPTSSEPYGKSIGSVYLVFIYALLFTTTLPYMSIRFLSFKDDIKLYKLAFYMVPIGIILSLIPMVGLYIRYKEPGLEVPDRAMAIFLSEYVHPAAGGLITLFILFAMLSTISSVLQSLASALSYDMYVSFFNKEPKNADFLNRISVTVITVWTMILTYLAPRGMLNQIAYIGTGGLISMFVGPTIIKAFVDANAKVCFWSMLTGFFVNIILVFNFDIGWVEAPILAGLAGSIVYFVLGYVLNGMSFKKKELSN
ncbi:MAG: sodium:solute symporter family protein, partial [Tissierellia bacterium]|nr:sodium:solute symporter family protein [Tissierellia bacterium]